jgi:hypothetical protein
VATVRAHLAVPRGDYNILQGHLNRTTSKGVTVTIDSSSAGSDEELQHSAMIYGLLENRESCEIVMAYTGDGLRIKWAMNGIGYE